MNQTEKAFVDELSKISIYLTSDTVLKLFRYLELLLETNKTFNLTAITEYDEALFKHIYDSIIILNYPEYQKAETILDVGSGAGIPCIPLAICSPEKKFVSLDSTQKKIKFQEHTSQTMQIRNFQPIWSRAEDFIRNSNQYQQFDLAMARAVASINILAELTLPYVKLNGNAIYYKGKDYQEELQAGTKAINFLGGSIHTIRTIELPLEYGTRTMITVQKSRETSKDYPRKAGIPQKKPL